MNKKRILIIGSSSAIGCDVIRQIDDEETVVLAHYNSGKDRLETIQTEAKGKIVLVQADLSSENGAMVVADAGKALYGHPDKIVFLAAPHLTIKRFKDLKKEDFSQAIDMQLYTAVAILQQFLPLM